MIADYSIPISLSRFGEDVKSNGQPSYLLYQESLFKVLSLKVRKRDIFVR